MISVGNDIEEVARFKHLLENKPKLLLKIFTAYEWEYASFKNQAQTLAGIWCAKEAVVKALSSYSSLDIRNVEIKHHQNGAPYVSNIQHFSSYKSFEISVSISHTKNYAAAVCIIQKNV
jgi:holo-[acyl-carrier protein] synthase